MTTTESLRLSLDNALVKVQELETENRKLRESDPQRAEATDREREMEQLKELYEQALRDLQDRQQEVDETKQQLQELHRRESREKDLEQELKGQQEENERLCVERTSREVEWEQEKKELELEKYRLLEAERRKWEERETCLVQQIGGSRRKGDTTEDVGLVEDLTVDAEPRETPSVAASPLSTRPTISGTNDPLPEHGTVGHPSPTSQALEAALIAQQMPPIAKFSGDQRTGEPEDFCEWLEHFELVAGACQWSEQAKLVNLAMRLQGQAYSFYRSCTPSQRAKYSTLVDALKRRFTPVSIQAVQSSLFHERRQGPRESVDSFAQDLKTLFYKAYPRTLQGGQETEEMGRSVLSSQFIAGLRSDIKIKLAGQDGTIDQLLMKARFEEAKIRDLGSTSSLEATKTTTSSPVAPERLSSSDKNRRPEVIRRPRDRSKDVCHSCGGLGHYQRQCPFRKPVSKETHTRGNGKVATITPTPDQPSAPLEDIPPKDKPGPTSATKTLTEESCLPQWQDATVEQALEDTLVTLHGVKPTPQSVQGVLRPTPTTTVDVEGSPAQALIDTGSPVTIISLEFLVKALAQNLKGHAKEDIKEGVKRRLSPTSLQLRSYSGQPIPVVKQGEVQLSRGPYTIKACIQVQKDAPVDLLLGTDLQPLLGFRLIDEATEQPSAATKDPEVVKEDTNLPLTAKVCLLHAQRIPARHTKVVNVRVDGVEEVPGVTFAFQPAGRLRELTGLVLEEAVVGAREVTALAITNTGYHPIQLQEGQLLGQVDQVKLIREIGIPPEDADDDQEETRVCHVVNRRPDNSDLDCCRRLLQSLGEGDWNIDRDRREKLQALVERYADVFALDHTELGCAQDVVHIIDTSDHEPIKQHPRRVPFALRAKVEEMISQMLKDHVIKPSRSPWASPIVLVAKKDGSTRFCVDYRKLNAITKKDVYPLPRIDDTLDLLAANKFFSTLDLASGYWQIQMDESTMEKTAFTTHVGLYEFAVMPFGLCNAPATFQRLMETVLHGLVGKVCLVYLDDVLVLGKTIDEHLQNLESVWQRLQQAGLRLKPSKCHLLREEVEYLGYRVSANGISTDPRKVVAVQNYPVPSDVTALRSFLGLVSYYRRFVANFSVIANPLFALTRKGTPFVWSPKCQEAFQRLKDTLTSAAILAFPDFSREFLLETDASIHGLGAVLSQVQATGGTRPIAFASRTLQSHEKNYGSTELEGLAVVWAAKHFRQYLYGHRCQVYTDHEALKALLNTPHPSGKLARWGLVVQEMDLIINYRPGRKNEKADALSRYPVEREEDDQIPPVIAAVSSDSTDEEHAQAGDPSPTMPLQDRQRLDPELRPMILYLEDGELPEDPKQAKLLAAEKSQYAVIEGVLYHVARDGSLRVIPPSTERQQLFWTIHAGKLGGHLREAKIVSTLGKHYWWPRMRKDVTAWCKSCLPCATRQVGRAIKPNLMPIPVGGPFDRIGVDVLQLPKSSKGNTYAVVFMDYLTKWPEVYPTKDQSAPTIARLLVEKIVCRHGVPGELLSDRGAVFLSGLLSEMYRLLDIHKVSTTAYHPQTDGLVERFNRTLLEMLSKTATKSGKDWDTRLPFILYAYRVSTHPSTGESPFYLLYGRDARLPTDEALMPPVQRYPIDTTDYRAEFTTKMSEAWESARYHVKKAQSRQKKYHDRHAKPKQFTPGDRVFVYMPAAKSGQAWKLARPYHGPFRIVKVMEGGVEVAPVNRPQDKSFRVSLQRVRPCPDEIGNEFYPSRGPRSPPTPLEPDEETLNSGNDEAVEWTERLRPREGRGRLHPQAGEM